MKVIRRGEGCVLAKPCPVLFGNNNNIAIKEMGFLSNLFKSSGKDELKEKVQNGALLLDVRTKEEYRAGRAPGSINIPLDDLTEETDRLEQGVPVVVVCASGARSAYAENFLKSKGFEAYNGGSWLSFMNLAKK